MANVLRRWWRTTLLLVLAPALLVGTATPSSDAAPHKKKPPCATDLASCPKTGCALLDDDKTEDERQADALLNRLKQTTSTNGTPIRVSFDDLAKLQELADAAVGQGESISPQRRGLLQDLALSASRKVSEGDLVELRGFVVQDSPRPKPSGAESVNCRLAKAINNDIHIPIVEDAEDEEFAAVVVEMIPQGRPDGWISKKLKRAARDDRPIIVRGRLFYDNKHKVNSDSEQDNGQPKRFTLWEIHPVTEFHVCVRADRKCGDTLAKPKDWKRLEDF